MVTVGILIFSILVFGAILVWIVTVMRRPGRFGRLEKGVPIERPARIAFSLVSVAGLAISIFSLCLQLIPSVVVVNVEPREVWALTGDVQDFEVTVTYSNRTKTIVTNETTWRSSNSSVATIDEEGKASALKAGESTITAIYRGIESDGATLHVDAPQPDLFSVRIEPAESRTIKVGAWQVYEARGYYVGGIQAPITLQVDWESSDPSVATIDNHGVARGAQEGETIIMAMRGEIVSNRAKLTVKSLPAGVQSIEVTHDYASVMQGSTWVFQAIGNYPDGTQANITADVVWESSDPSVATIDNRGVAYAKGLGTTKITAIQGTVTSHEVLLAVTAPTLELRLSGGWNLVTLPLWLEDYSVEAIFGGTRVTKVYSWDAMGDTWQLAAHEHGNWTGVLQELEFGEVYWVFAEEPTALVLHSYGP